jgi:hypothetical protein
MIVTDEIFGNRPRSGDGRAGALSPGLADHTQPAVELRAILVIVRFAMSPNLPTANG